jgi:hypothetical protein
MVMEENYSTFISLSGRNSFGVVRNLFEFYYRIYQVCNRYMPGISHNKKNLVYPCYISILFQYYQLREQKQFKSGN